MPKSFGLLLASILLTACITTAVADRDKSPHIPTPTMEAAATTPFSKPILTRTPIITALTTNSSFTPTFDARAIVTSTPAPAAECPKENPDILPVGLLPPNGEPYDVNFINRAVRFLNDGGTAETLESVLTGANKWGGRYGSLQQADITNDGVPELILKLYQSNFIVKCDNFRYSIIFARQDTVGGTRLAVTDLNRNGIPDVMVSIDPCVDSVCNEMWVLEWGGAKLEILLHDSNDVISTADLNGDGVQEIIGIEYPGSNEYDPPTTRTITTIYEWNGVNFGGMSH